MKQFITIIRLFTTFAVTAFATTAFAQQNINPTLEVKRDYENKLPAIHKSKLSTDFNDSISNFALNFNYSVFDKEYKDLYEFAPSSAVRIQRQVIPAENKFYARVGISFPLSPEIFFAYTPNIGSINRKSKFLNNSSLMFYGSHNSYWGKIPLQDIQNINGKNYTHKTDKRESGNDSRTNAGVAFRHSWQTGQLSTIINYTHGFNEFYGKNLFLYESGYTTDYTNINSHSFNKIAANFNINSLTHKQEERGFNYKGNIDYSYVGDKSLANIKAHYIAANWEMGPSVGDYSKILVNISVNNSLNSVAGKNNNYGFFSITPTYNFNKGGWHFKIGGTYSAKYAEENSNDNHNFIFAKANVKYQIIKNKLAFEANIDGGNYLNNYALLLEQNPWISPFIDNQISSIPISTSAGLSGNIKGILDYEIKGGYIINKGLPQYIPDINNPATFTLTYNNTDLMFLSANIGINTQSFIGNINVRYNNYSNHKPYNYAPFEASLYGEYNYMQRIYFGLTLYTRGNTPTYYANGYSSGDNSYTFLPDTYIKNFINLGVTAKYVINRTFSVYINGKNLLGNRDCYYPQYFEKGLRIGAGVLVKL